jgi:hypothetical protein
VAGVVLQVVDVTIDERFEGHDGAIADLTAHVEVILRNAIDHSNEEIVVTLPEFEKDEPVEFLIAV